MNLQESIRDAKQYIRAFIRTNWDDQKLLEVYAFNADGKMSYFHGCNCLMGVTLSDKLHKEMCEEFKRTLKGNLPADKDHYSLAHALPGSLNAEVAYRNLGARSWAGCHLYSTTSDQRRRVRLSALLRAEIRRRARAGRETLETIGSQATR